MAVQNWQEWAISVERRLAALEKRQDMSDILDGVNAANVRLRELKDIIEARSVSPADITALEKLKTKLDAIDPVKP